MAGPWSRWRRRRSLAAFLLRREAVKNHAPLLRMFLGALALAAACTTTPSPQAQRPARIKDTVPERVAAQRDAQKDLNLEGEDERWGIEAARERKNRAGRTDNGAAPADPAGPGPAGGGPTDLRQTASPPSRPGK